MNASPDAATGPITMGDRPSTRRSWRRWRRTRPFWAGCWTIAAAALLLVIPYSIVRVGDLTISLSTVGGSSALVIGVALLGCAAMMWFRPDTRVVAGVITIVVSVAALAMANLGAFGMGTTLGILGGSLAVAWAPGRDEDAPVDGDAHRPAP